MTYNEWISEMFSMPEPPVLSYLDNLKRRIESLGLPVALYGIGLWGTFWLKELSRENIKVSYLADAQRGGANGDILTLDALAEQTGGNVLLIVTPYVITSDKAARNAFSDKCSRLNIDTVELVPYLCSTARRDRWRFAGYPGGKEEMQAVLGMLEDHLSRYSYCEFIQRFLSGDSRPSSVCFSVKRQYIASELFILDKDDYIADCGAYTGDSLEIFAAHFPSIRGIAAFEPTEESFEALRDTASRVNVRVDLYNKATGAFNGRASLSLNHDSAAANTLVDAYTGGGD